MRREKTLGKCLEEKLIETLQMRLLGLEGTTKDHSDFLRFEDFPRGFYRVHTASMLARVVSCSFLLPSFGI